MSLEAFIDLIAAIGVILSVIYLALETRKNARYVKANFYDSIVNSNTGFLEQLIKNPHLSKLFEKSVESWDKLSLDDKRTANFLFIQLFRLWENMFYQNKMKTLEPWLWENSHKNTILSYFHQPGVQQWWSHRKQTFAPEFRTFLESSTKPENEIQVMDKLVDPEI